MKGSVGFLLFCMVLTGCNENGDSTERKLDSLERRIDTTAEKVWDSTKSKAKELKERIENRLERRDSVKNDDTIGRN